MLKNVIRAVLEWIKFHGVTCNQALEHGDRREEWRTRRKTKVDIQIVLIIYVCVFP
jgi:hypothetical protein